MTSQHKIKKILILARPFNHPPLISWAKKRPGYEIEISTSKQCLENLPSLHAIPDYDLVIGTSDLDAILAAAICQHLAIPCPPPQSVYNSYHKYYSRLTQEKYHIPGTPRFALAREIIQQKTDIPFPLIIKPIFSSASKNTYFVNSIEELQTVVEKDTPIVAARNREIKEYLEQWGLDNYLNTEHYADFLCEEKLYGEQITVDGYIDNGTVGFFGVTKSNFLENGISFSQFDYPHVYQEELTNQIQTIVGKAVQGLQLDNCLFNVEMMVDEQTNAAHIIEVNPRISFQFSYLIESVTGVNPLDKLCEIILKDKIVTPKAKVSAFCSSCVLRIEKDKIVTDIPDEKTLQSLQQKYGEFQFRPLVDIGMKLSDISQDPYTFRYAFIDIPGASLSDIKKKRELLEKELIFSFQEV